MAAEEHDRPEEDISDLPPESHAADDHDNGDNDDLFVLDIEGDEESDDPEDVRGRIAIQPSSESEADDPFSLNIDEVDEQRIEDDLFGDLDAASDDILADAESLGQPSEDTSIEEQDLLLVDDAALLGSHEPEPDPLQADVSEPDPLGSDLFGSDVSESAAAEPSSDIPDFDPVDSTFDDSGPGAWESADQFDDALGLGNPPASSMPPDPEPLDFSAEEAADSAAWQPVDNGSGEWAPAQPPLASEGEPPAASGEWQSIEDSGAWHPVDESGAWQPVDDSGTWQPADSGAWQSIEDSGSWDALDSGSWQPVDEAASWRGTDNVGGDADMDAPEVEHSGEFDPIYGERPAETAMEAHPAFREQEPDYRSLEPMMRDAAEHPVNQVVGGGTGPIRNVWMRRIMAVSMVACVLILGLVVFVTIRPDVPFAKRFRGVLGLKTQERPAVHVALVPRPEVKLDLDVPGIAISEDMRVAIEGGAKDPTGKTPVDPPDNRGTLADVSPESRAKFERLMSGLQWAGRQAGTLAKSYVARRRVAAGPDRGQKPPTRPDPGPITKVPDNVPTTDLPVRTGPPDGPTTSQPNGGQPEVTIPVAKVPKGARLMTGYGNGIVRGAQAFAQLHNGNFFVGRIRKVVPEELVMTLDSGEISFVPGELQKLLPLAEAEANVLRSGPNGYVVLKNKNKIWGKILETLPDVIAIQTGQSRIVVPRVAIETVSRKPEARIQLGREEEDWESDLPNVEGALPVPERDESHIPEGTIRVKIDNLESVNEKRAEKLKDRIRKRAPGVLPRR